tara:strand:+ start:487 stop:810 length:324 start_codon:yes stop_codon:yes gene_type:complete
MKEKIITIKPKGITQKQWSNLLLELNLIKKAWKPYGVDMEIKAPGLKNIIKWGTTINYEPKRNRRTGNKVEQDDGIDNTKRWRLSISSSNKTDDGTYVFIGKRTRFI